MVALPMDIGINGESRGPKSVALPIFDAISESRGPIMVALPVSREPKSVALPIFDAISESRGPIMVALPVSREPKSVALPISKTLRLVHHPVIFYLFLWGYYFPIFFFDRLRTPLLIFFNTFNHL
jgi:hypothetical protein